MLLFKFIQEKNLFNNRISAFTGQYDIKVHKYYLWCELLQLQFIVLSITFHFRYFFYIVSLHTDKSSDNNIKHFTSQTHLLILRFPFTYILSRACRI